MDKALLIWGVALLVTVHVAEKQRHGCRECGVALKFLQAIRTSVCPQCERALNFVNSLW